MEFNFQPMLSPEGSSPEARSALLVAQLAEKLALEDRTLVHHITGRVENVAEHSNMLAIVAPILCEQLYPELNSNLVARYAALHDIVEAYVGDTPTQAISVTGMAAKQVRERAGLAQLQIDYNWLPMFVEKINEYEEQLIPETRFVRVADKLMPLLIHCMDNGQILKTHLTAEALLQNSAERAAQLRVDYPEFELLIALREELTQQAVTQFLL